MLPRCYPEALALADRKLTKSVVEGLEVKPKDYVVWCAKLPGFGCRVRPSGSKSFIAFYRVGGRNAAVRKVTIGAFGKVTVEEARKAATEILAKAELGEDVAEARTRQRAEMTVAQLCDEYLIEGVETKKASTLVTDRSRIERHIKPLLGRKRLSEVTSADIERFVKDVANGKTALDVKTGNRGRACVTGGKGTATRTARLLGGIFTYAVRRKYVATNPRQGVKLYDDKKGERFLSEPELKRLGATLCEAETVGLPWNFNEGKSEKHRPLNAKHQREVISPFAIAAIRLLMLTGCRLGEILGLRWTEVDLENGLLHLPDSKTGAKRIMIGSPAVAVLESIPRTGKYVIAGANPDRPRSDLKKPWARIIAHADLDGLRLHDLRHSYASKGAASGMGLTIVGKLLGHRSTATTARYSHFADDPLRRASDAISEAIAAAMGAPTKAVTREANDG